MRPEFTDGSVPMDGGMNRPRPVARMARGMPASDGAGVKLNRVIGTPQLPDVDPFLMLDEFRSDDAADYIAGFPDHPHRGFETVTYMLAGRMRHGDNKGHSGLLEAGSVQWMTAGRGIVHSEMPEQENGLMQGFQLWVNLPAKDKMIEPRYQEIPPRDIPIAALPGGAAVKVIAGAVGKTRGPVQGIATDPLLLDLAIPAGASLELPVRRGHNVFLYAFEGEAAIGEAATALPRGSIAVLGAGDSVRVAAANAAARLLLAAARPLNEPVARYGPFVMNTTEQLRQAIIDFQSGRF
jgi:redox-sensitive bicupin YhaK (pirin superfamily)